MSRRVTAEVYDGRPYTVGHIVRARCEVDGVPYALEECIPKGMSHKIWMRRTLLNLYQNLFGLRRFLIVDYWRLKLYLSPKGYHDATKPCPPSD